MTKSERQIYVETTSGVVPQVGKLRVVKESEHSPAKVGEIVTVKRWGTYGCWDEKNRWIDFYCCEIVK